MSKNLLHLKWRLEFRAASQSLQFTLQRFLTTGGFFATSAKYGAYIILRYADLSRERAADNTHREPFNFFFFTKPKVVGRRCCQGVSFGIVNYDSLLVLVTAL